MSSAGSRLSKLTVVLSDDELETVVALADGLPLSPFVRRVLLRLAENDDLAQQIRQALNVAPPKPQPEG